MGETPDYSWRNKLATVYNAKRTGNLFLPLPGGYVPAPGEIDRGSITPQVTGLEPGTVPTNSTVVRQPTGVPFPLRQSDTKISGYIKPMVPGKSMSESYRLR